MTCFLRRGAAALLTLCLALPLFGCSGSDMPTESKTPRSDTAVATLCAVGDIRITDELLQAARQGGSYDFSDILRGCVILRSLRSCFRRWEKIGRITSIEGSLSID